MEELGVDLMTISAHKIYGPKGAGALIARAADRIQQLSPVVTGGGQEFGLRSGTENVPAIVGFGASVEIAMQMRKKEAERVQKLTAYFWDKLQHIVRGVTINGSIKNRLPNNLNVAVSGISSEELVIALDMKGVAVSAGSACSMRSLEPSHVLKAIGASEKVLNSSIRFSLGRSTTKNDIDYVLNCVQAALKKS